MKIRSRVHTSTAEFSDDEANNNKDVLNPKKKPSSATYIHNIASFFSLLFSLFCAVYTCFAVSQLMGFLSGNACGILNLSQKINS